MRRHVFANLMIADLSSAPTLALAQQNVPSCATNIVDGLLFAGFHGTVTTPAEFATVTSDSNALWPLGDVRLGAQMLVIAAPAQVNTPVTLSFHGDDNTVVFECSVMIAPYTGQFPLANSGVGDCDLQPVAETGTLSVGQTQTLQTPTNLMEITAGPSTILRASPRSARTIEVTGIGSGTGFVAWLGADEGAGTLRGLCPLTVQGG